MEPTAEKFDSQAAGRPAVSFREAQQEDKYWQRAFWQERYYSSVFDYEDYAPAYCVGYVGFLQYGGEFVDAQRCLCANWERIKGDSRLSVDQALRAVRAAWDRMAALRRRQHATALPDAATARRERAPRAPASSTCATPLIVAAAESQPA